MIIPLAAGPMRSADQSRLTEALSGNSGRYYVEALTAVWAGIGAFLTGRWEKASHSCSRAATILRDHCTGVTWELNLAQNFFLFSLVYRGELREVAGHLPGLLRSARERGNAYLELELSTRMSLIWLAADEPVEAERRANEGIARWAQNGFQRPHYHHFITLLQTRLYRGHVVEAWQLMEQHRVALRQNLFRRVQHTRVEIATLRARCALAMAGRGAANAPHMREVAKEASEHILQEAMAWADPFAWLIQATIASQEGAVPAAVEMLSRAVQGFDAAGMHLYAAVCRRRLCEVVEGDAGDALRDQAERWMAAQNIRNPAAMTRLLAPGFPD